MHGCTLLNSVMVQRAKRARSTQTELNVKCASYTATFIPNDRMAPTEGQKIECREWKHISVFAGAEGDIWVLGFAQERWDLLNKLGLILSPFYVCPFRAYISGLFCLFPGWMQLTFFSSITYIYSSTGSADTVSKKPHVHVLLCTTVSSLLIFLSSQNLGFISNIR